MFVAILAICIAAVAALYFWLQDAPLRSLSAQNEPNIRKAFTTKNVRAVGDPDMIVIGSGLGGLTTAALMAKQGKKVLVLEQHDVAGGCTHSFVGITSGSPTAPQSPLEFDVGLHYIGGKVTEREKGIGALLNNLCSTPIEFADLGEVFDMAVFPDRRVPIKAGFKNLRNGLLEQYPEEAEAIDRYFAYMRETTLAYPRSFVYRILPQWIPEIVRSFLRRGLWDVPLKYSNRTVAEVLDEITSNQSLKDTLAYVSGDYGLPPSKASWVIHCMVVTHYFKGAFYPVGGASVFAKAIVPTIERAGGAVLVRANVTKILIENGKAAGVVVSKGGEEITIRSPVVVSAAGVANTVMRLLPPEAHELWPEPLQDLKLSKVVKPSCAHINVFVGLNGSSEELKLPKYNTWKYMRPESLDDMSETYYASRPEGECAPDVPGMFVGFPSAKDPDFANRYPGKSVCTIVAEAPYAVFEKWGDTTLHRRGDDYEALKASFKDQILKKLFEEFPQLEGRVEYAELGTPLTNNYYLGAVSGESYGLEHSPDRFSRPWLKPQTPIPGLWLSGQDVATCGIFGAMMGGYLTAMAMDFRVALKNAKHFVGAS